MRNVDWLLIDDLGRQVDQCVALQVLDEVDGSVQTLSGQLVQLELLVYLDLVVLDGDLLPQLVRFPV